MNFYNLNNFYLSTLNINALIIYKINCFSYTYIKKNKKHINLNLISIQQQLLKFKKIKNSFKFLIFKYINIKKNINKRKFFNFYKKKLKNFLFNLSHVNNALNFLPSNLPLFNLLKKKPNLNIKSGKLLNYLGYIYIKSSGINTFITLTNIKGEVLPRILQEFLKK